MYRQTKLSLLAVTLATAGSMVWAAAGAPQNDALAAAQARITLTQAISAAEQHAQGKAVKAEYEHDKGAAHYEVEVVSGAKVFDVRVDANQGTVLSSQEDRAD